MLQSLLFVNMLVLFIGVVVGIAREQVTEAIGSLLAASIYIWFWGGLIVILTHFIIKYW